MSRAFRVKGLNALTRRGRRMHLSYATEKSYAGWAQSFLRAVLKCVLDLLSGSLPRAGINRGGMLSVFPAQPHGGDFEGAGAVADPDGAVLHGHLQ